MTCYGKYCHFDFPLYTICQILKESCYCIAGGGGLSKTGVKNKIVILVFDNVNQVFNLKKEEEIVYGAVTSSVWSQNLKTLILVAENYLLLYEINEKINGLSYLIEDIQLTMKKSIDLTQNSIIQSDHSINVIKLFHEHVQNRNNMLLIGTSIGSIILFNLETHETLIKVSGGCSEVNDISLDISNHMLACALHGKHSYVYNLPAFEPIVDLQLDFDKKSKDIIDTTYIIRNCLFTRNNFLVTTHHQLLTNSSKKFNRNHIEKFNFMVIWSQQSIVPLLKYSFEHTNSIFLHQSVNNYFILGCTDGSLNIFDGISFKLIKSIQQKHQLAMTSICSHNEFHSYDNLLNGSTSYSANFLSVITIAADATLIFSNISLSDKKNVLSGILSIVAVLYVAVAYQVYVGWQIWF